MIFYFSGINVHAMHSEDVLFYFEGGVLFACYLKFIYHLVWGSFSFIVFTIDWLFFT